MKTIISIIMFCVVSFSYAQELETVYSITKERHELSWYETQLKLWKVEIDKNEQNANAWYNYYSAARALRNLSVHEDGKPKEEYIELCKTISEDAIKKIPETFEGNHLYWWQQGLGSNKVEYLEKAHKISPNDPRAFDDLLINYELKRNKEGVKNICNKMYDGNELAPSILNWGYNLLSGLDKNAVIFTHGDNDTYALWIIQNAKEHRKDVTVINTSLILLDEYRKHITDELGLPEIELEKTAEGQMNVCKAILTNDKDVPVYVAVTAISQFSEPSIKENLYLTGLAYKYCKTSFNNMGTIQRNFEKRYLLDHLKVNFGYHLGNDVARNIEGLYLPSLIKLYKHYSESENLSRKAEVEELIIRISERTGQQSEVYEVLGTDDRGELKLNFPSTLLNVRSLEKNMVKLEGNIFMSKYETSNNEYRTFLDNVLRSRQVDLFKSVNYDSTQWHEKFKKAYLNPMVNLYHWHPAYDEYPIVNISFDAAEIYCQWLTKQYNLQRKREYMQVKFRLPTEGEWRKAALAGSTGKTGFKDDKIQNEEACYLLNIQPSEGRFFDDGAFLTAKVETYNPNAFGFYNMFGNVAEMIDKRGVSKGGSWFSSIEESYVDEETKFTGADPRIGFRIVMEVIEE